MLHGALDENPSLVSNIIKFLDADEKEFLLIKNANIKLLNQIKTEIGIETGINSFRGTC